jgi:hypothetical protein
MFAAAGFCEGQDETGRSVVLPLVKCIGPSAS